MMYTSQIINGDEVRSVGGSGYETVSGKDKIRQDVKMVLTTNTRNTTGLGAQLEDSIGKDVENPASFYTNTPFMFEFQMRVKSALDRLKRIQRRFQYSYRVPAELIHEFTTVNIWPVKEDPRNFRWKVDIITVDGSSKISIKGGMRI